jgi:hypothetical protein
MLADGLTLAVAGLASTVAMRYEDVMLAAVQHLAETDLYPPSPQLLTVPTHLHGSIFCGVETAQPI